MTQTPIHDVVQEHYAERVRQSDPCCAPDSASTCCDSKNVLYPEDLLTTMPDDIANFSLGCGDPITLAELQPGQTVLDLGSGGGLDCFLAANTTSYRDSGLARTTTYWYRVRACNVTAGCSAWTAEVAGTTK